MPRAQKDILIITLILASFGIVMVYSSSAIYAHQRLGDSLYFLKRHLFYFFIGLAIMTYLARHDYTRLASHSRGLLLTSVILLVLVLLPQFGREVAGAKRWLRIWKFGFQPSEFVKLALVVYLADYLSRKQAMIKSIFRGFLPAFLVSGVLVGLVLLQPDLGTAALMALVAFTLLFVGGTRLGYLLPVAGFSVPLFYFLIKGSPYRMKRIMAYLDPWKDPKGVGFQIIQSFLALGSGGLVGVGLGRSQQKLFYLPQSHTDFIFSIIGEELGLVGSLSIVILFGLFIWGGTKVILDSPDLLGALLSLGVVLMIGLQAIVHIGVATGSIPTKGLPFPFISYGGSSLVFNMAGVGILLSVARKE